MSEFGIGIKVVIVCIMLLGVDIFVSSTGNFSIALKKWKNQAFIGNAGEFHDAIDFTGSEEGFDGIEVDPYKVDVCFIPVELDEKVSKLHVLCSPSLRRNWRFLEVSRSKALLLCTSRDCMCSSMSFPSSVGTPEVFDDKIDLSPLPVP